MLSMVCASSERPLLRSRIEQTVGVRFDLAKETNGYPVIVPRGPWLPVEEKFVNTYCLDWSGQIAPGEYLGFVRLSAAAHDRIVTFMEWYFAVGNRDLAHCQQHEREITLFETICEPQYPEVGRPTFFGIARGQPGMEVSTIDQAIGWRVGLHIDNFDRLSIPARRWARNRISVNVGAERRYLLFVPITSQEILEIVSSRLDPAMASPSPPGLEHMHLVWQFFQLFPDTVIYRLSIDPGEAYLAPTENIIHDGSTLGMIKNDWQMVWLGHFTWPMLNH